MSTVFDIVVNWTAPIEVDLLDDEETPDGILSGTIDLILKNVDGTEIDFSGDVSVIDGAGWRVRVSPDDGDFSAAGTYRGRFKVTDDSGKIAYWPNAVWDQWVVREEA